ncbi:MAG: hypothetical protein GC204_16980 [Chloroflexi bacterium]|nr:hypothetical protein [Chloroflexota bacterium]
MKNLTPALLTLLAALVLGIPQQTSAVANPIPFSKTIIDSANSGDDKAIADIDKDGKPDGILGGSVAGRSLVWYDSGHNFAMHVIRSNPVYAEFSTDMQAADMDGDGDSDIIVGDGGGANNILWFENPLINPPAGHTADPKLEANWTYHVIGTQGDWVHDIEIGDFNNDGKKDIVTSGHGITHLWIQNSPTSWSDKNLSALAGQGVFIGDIDRDGRADIATPQGWLKNPGNPLSGTWVKYPINGTSGDEVLLGDLNGDGRLDVLTMNAHQRLEFAWFEAPSDPTTAAWTKHVIDPAMGAHHPEIADFNNDGKPDILMGLELVDLSIYLNNGGASPTFTKDKLDTSGGHNARAGDLNGDGKIDIFASDYIGNPPVRIYLNQGQFSATATPTATRTFTPTSTRTVPPTATRTFTATATRTVAATATRTFTPTATRTVAATATRTFTPTATRTVPATATRTPLPATATRTFTATATRTFTPTATRTFTPTATRTVAATATRTFTPTATRTFTATATRTVPPTATRTFTATATRTVPPTATRTVAPTATPTSGRAQTGGSLILGLGFEEGTGGTTTDTSGYNNTGSLLNGAAWTNQGKFGNAIQFDGVDDRVRVADSPSLHVTNGLTMEAWVYPTRANNWSAIVIKEIPNSFSYVLYGWWFGTDSAAGTTSGGERATSGGGMLPLNTWTHIAMTYNGAQQILYINGKVVASNADTGFVTVTNDPLSIGGNGQASNEVFTGKIDEVRVYNVALSQADIQRDMNAPVVPAPKLLSANIAAPALPEAVTETVSPSPEQTETLEAESTETVTAPAESTEAISAETTELVNSTDTPTPTPTDTPTEMPTATETVTLTATFTETASLTPTPTETFTPESTDEPTFTPTAANGRG